MFVPALFRVEDRGTLYDFVEQYRFATLVSVCGGGPLASHVPLLLDRTRVTLLGDLARANPQWEAFVAGAESLAIISGPHAHVSPSWYASAPAVPTWNYAVEHVYGPPQLLAPDRTREVVDVTVRKYEELRAAPWPNVIPDEVRKRLLAGRHWVRDANYPRRGQVQAGAQPVSRGSGRIAGGAPRGWGRGRRACGVHHAAAIDPFLRTRRSTS